MIEIRYLRHFIEVVEARGFRRAARNIGLSAPSLVRSVKILEDFYGVELLFRGRKEVKPTEYGRQLLRHSRIILNEIDSIPDHLGKMTGFVVGRLRAGISPVIMDYCTRPVVARIIQEHPDVEIVIDVGRADILLQKLSDGDVDLIMCIDYPLKVHGNLEIHNLYNEQAFCYVRKDHPISGAEIVPLKAFVDYPFFHQKLPSTLREWKNDLALAVRRETGESIDTTGSIECADYSLLVGTILETNGMALLPCRNALIEGRENLLTRLKLPLHFPEFRMAAAYPLSMPAPPLTHLFIDLMREKISELDSAVSLLERQDQ
jgi:DNA-binding transcriptional LysR family regulator